MDCIARLLAVISLGFALAVAVASSKAHSAPYHHHHRHHHHHVLDTSGDPRPAAWCGWWLRHYLGIADKTLNLAVAWARVGTPASGPCVGCVAVWPHHVGVVTAVPGPGRIVLKSGNTGPKRARGVYEAERSTRGVIAWRSL